MTLTPLNRKTSTSNNLHEPDDGILPGAKATSLWPTRRNLTHCRTKKSSRNILALRDFLDMRHMMPSTSCFGAAEFLAGVEIEEQRVLDAPYPDFEKPKEAGPVHRRLIRVMARKSKPFRRVGGQDAVKRVKSLQLHDMEIDEA